MPLIPLNIVHSEADRPDRSLLVDIIAVHGVNETSIDAWTDLASQILWLRDLLPGTIQRARVLSYGHSASVDSFYGKGSIDKIQQHAHTLVKEIQEYRALDDCSHRPIIFVCHGLGGMLVKKALFYASTKLSSEKHLYSVFISTYAVLFFGTPHEGCHETNWTFGKTPNRLFRRSGKRRDWPTLRMISDEFANLTKQFRLHLFWETRETDYGGEKNFVVEEASAAPLIKDAERIGLDATHSSMVKLTDEHKHYLIILNAVTQYCHEAPPVISRRWKHAHAVLGRADTNELFNLMGTAFDVHNDNQPFQYVKAASKELRNKHFHIPQAVSSIFTGREDISREVEAALFTQDPEVARQQKRFIIYGIGGSGKTQFTCKFAQDFRESFWGVFWIDATSAETAKQSFSRLGKLGGLEGTQDSGKHWLSHLEEPWLLILNNADDPNLDLQSLFPDGERGYILVTTTNPDTRIHATVGSAEFMGLEESEAVTLLLKAADIPRPWDQTTREIGTQIANTLGYLALALIQAGALILQRICGLKDFLAFYNDYRSQSRPRASSRNKEDTEKHMIYSTWDLSLHSLEKKQNEASRDAAQLLCIVAFFHFEHIRVDVFSRALTNRSKTSESSGRGTLSENVVRSILDRLQPPPALPDFLKDIPARQKPHRVRKALHELRSFSLISYDGSNDSFSLHPVVHAWARDRLGTGEQALWARVALNTLGQSIQLPPDSDGASHEEFRRDILSHLDSCLAASPIQNLDFNARFGSSKSPLKLALQYVSLLSFREEVLLAAKCGYVYAERGRFNDATELLSKVVTALVQSRGYENEWTMRAMLALAGTYWGLGRLEEAIALQKRVVEARTAVFGPNHKETLTAMDQQGRSHWLNGQYKESRDLQTITTEGMKVTLGEKHPETLAAMDNLGVSLGSWHEFKKSERIHREVLEWRQESLGATHVDTLTTMNNLAMALLDLGQLDESYTYMKKVYEERKTKLGKEHPWTLWALCNLAKVELERGNLKEAEDMIAPGIEAAKRSLSADHLGVLMGRGVLARVLAKQGRLNEAEDMTLETLRRLEKSRGIEHPDTVYGLYKMAKLYQSQKKMDKAISTCELAVMRAEMRLTKEHPLGVIICDYLRKLKTSTK